MISGRKEYLSIISIATSLTSAYVYSVHHFRGNITVSYHVYHIKYIRLCHEIVTPDLSTTIFPYHVFGNNSHQSVVIIEIAMIIHYIHVDAK